MVQVVENWAELTGTVRSIAQSSKGPEHRTLTIAVDSVDDVEGFPNLISAPAGESVLVIARSGVVERSDVQEGRRVRCRVRKATPFEIFVHPDGFVQLTDEHRPVSADDRSAAVCDPTIEPGE